jgi:DNA-binding transcriptional MocR family regulator
MLFVDGSHRWGWNPHFSHGFDTDLEKQRTVIERYMPPGAIRFERPTGGIYFWCRLSRDVRAREVLRHAMATGVAFVAGEAFYPDPAGLHELRLCFSSARPAELDEGIKRLAESSRRASAETAAPANVAIG